MADIRLIDGASNGCQTVALGFDAALDYKQGDLRRALHAASPKAVDVCFDNVVLDHALMVLARHACIVICGAVSQ